MSDKPEQRASGTSTSYGYTVEARLPDPCMPREIAGQIIYCEWREVEFNKVPPQYGVPRVPPYQARMIDDDLLSHEAAQAMRWWFHAIAAENYVNTLLQTRLVRYRCTRTHETIRTDYTNEVDGSDALRSNIPIEREMKGATK